MAGDREPIADTGFHHHVKEESRRHVPHRVSGEVHVLGCRGQRLALLRAYRDEPCLLGAIVNAPDARRTHLAAAYARPDDIADATLFYRPDVTLTLHPFG